MCGICGIYNINGQPVDPDRLRRMTQLVRHRGPDDEGYLLANTGDGSFRPCHGDDTIQEIAQKTYSVLDPFPANLGFGFRRLSILDLSPNGHQPMPNEDETLWIVFNGEIYNYIELRDELIRMGYRFRSNTDTEVILRSYEAWGTGCLSRFNGMWAFALYDRNACRLFCARDRFGIKPLQFFFDGSSFIFASEIKQILIHPIDKSLNYRSIQKGFYHSMLINPDGTFFSSIKILPHSHYLLIENGKLSITRYYDLPVAEFDKSRLSFTEACSHYRKIFIDSVRLRMRSDVEVGSALSGGLDSSAIVSVASGLTSGTFKTFSSYYDDAPQFDERKWIRLVNERTKSEGHLVSAPVSKVIDDFETMTWHHDYPLPGSSPVAQYYVMQLANRHGMKVLLDGQGSDEISAGYDHAFYRYHADLFNSLHWGRFLKEFLPYLASGRKGSLLDKKLKTFLTLLFREPTLYYYETRLHPGLLTIPWDHCQDYYPEIRHLPVSRLSNFLYNQMMSTSIQTLLHFEDRNSMAHSIESRVPFLDYRLVEHAFSLPASFKIRDNLGKYFHRQSLQDIVPGEILQRRDKIGFLTPGEFFWLRGEMKDYVRSVLDSSAFAGRGIYNVKLIRDEYRKYLLGKQKNAALLWKVIALEVWFRVFGKLT